VLSSFHRALCVCVWKFLSRAKRNNNEKRRNKTLQICPSSSAITRSRFALLKKKKNDASDTKLMHYEY